MFIRMSDPKSAPMPWQMGNGRCLVVRWSKGSAVGDGTLFEDVDGTQLVLRAARTQAEARAIALTAGKGANILKIHPELDWPDDEWVKGDPEFWRVHREER
jgi:hypothetical protein